MTGVWIKVTSNQLQLKVPGLLRKATAKTAVISWLSSQFALQDKAASDSMDPTLDMMKVNRLIRSAVGLVKGTQLKQSDNSFEITVLSGILWFKVTL